tara:strand:- start:53267 stop:54454 length:1188 start_codon:yes stop_codon:yes gene_type:complete
MTKIFTGDNFSVNKSPTVTFNDKKKLLKKENKEAFPLEIGFGQVTGIITSKLKDGSEGPSGIKVSLTKRSGKNKKVSDPIRAYSLSKSNSKIPIINETVVCIRIDVSSNPSTSENWYYISDVNTNNNANNNIINGKTYNNEGAYFGKTFYPALLDNLKLFEGDSLFQGRFGNRIRFGSTNRFRNPEEKSGILNDWSSKEPAGRPITIISNGFRNVENLDEDPSSIYLTSGQSLPIYLQSPYPRELPKPEQFSGDENKPGSQVVICSDKLVFYSKTDDIVISSKGSSYLMGESVNISTNEWKIDVTSYSDLLLDLMGQVQDLSSQVSDLSVELSKQATATAAITVTSSPTGGPTTPPLNFAAFNSVSTKATTINTQVTNIKNGVRQINNSFNQLKQ